MFNVEADIFLPWAHKGETWNGKIIRIWWEMTIIQSYFRSNIAAHFETKHLKVQVIKEKWAITGLLNLMNWWSAQRTSLMLKIRSKKNQKWTQVSWTQTKTRVINTGKHRRKLLYRSFLSHSQHHKHQIKRNHSVKLKQSRTASPSQHLKKHQDKSVAHLSFHLLAFASLRL